MTETATAYDKSPAGRDLAISYLMAGATECTERDKLFQWVRDKLSLYLDNVHHDYPYLHEIIDTLDLVLDRGGTRRK